MNGLQAEGGRLPARWVAVKSRFFWIRIQKNLDSWRCPGFADGYLRESTGFPDLSIVIFGKPLVSPTCRSSSPGNHRFPRLDGGLQFRRSRRVEVVNLLLEAGVEPPHADIASFVISLLWRPVLERDAIQRCEGACA